MDSTVISVLLVEDDEVVRLSLRFALESVRIQVSEAGTVADGLRCLGEALPDVVVIDLHLPDGTGYDLARWLWRRQPRLPVVMISTDPDDVGSAPTLPPAHGRTTLLTKPFSASDLLDAISLVAADPAGQERHG